MDAAVAQRPGAVVAPASCPPTIAALLLLACGAAALITILVAPHTLPFEVSVRWNGFGPAAAADDANVSISSAAAVPSLSVEAHRPVDDPLLPNTSVEVSSSTTASRPPPRRMTLPPPSPSPSLRATDPSPAAGGGGGAVSVLPARRAYLIVTKATYGRYSNQREALLEAIALANFSGRTLVLPAPLAATRESTFDRAYDVDALKAAAGVEVALSVGHDTKSLLALCGSRYIVVNTGRAAGQPWGAHDSLANFRGVTSRVVDVTALPELAGAIPPALRPYATAPGVYRSPAYRALRTPHMERRIGSFLGPALLPYYLRASAASGDAKCVAMRSTFFGVNTAVMPGAFEAAVEGLRPPPWLARAVSQWLSARGITRGIASAGEELVLPIALHIRLTDQARRHGALGIGLAERCMRAETRGAVVADIQRFVQRHARAQGTRQTMVLLASDDPGSDCIVALLASFPPATRVWMVEAPGRSGGGGGERGGGGGGSSSAADRRPARPKRSSSGSSRSSRGKRLAAQDSTGIGIPPALRGHLPLDECLAAQFIQEILATSAVFLGSNFSTFSSAVHQIRVVRHHHAPATSLLL